MAPKISVFSLGIFRPPGLIHWKIVAAWLKNEILTNFMLNLIWKWEFLSTSKEEITQ